MFSVETIFEQDVGGLFQRMIDTVYQETSGHLLEVLHTKYKFMDHLKVTWFNANVQAEKKFSGLKK